MTLAKITLQCILKYDSYWLGVHQKCGCSGMAWLLLTIFKQWNPAIREEKGETSSGYGKEKKEINWISSEK